MKKLVAASITSAVLAATVVVLFMSALGVGTRSVTAGSTTAATATPVASESATSAEAIYKQAAPAIVQVTSQQAPTSSPFGLTQRGGEALGTGFVVDRSGHILTNAHVVDGAQQVTVTFHNNQSRTARVVKSNDSTDVALLSVDPSGLTLQPLELGDSTSLQVGDAVYAIGNPLGLNDTLTTGLVSALGRQIQAPNGAAIPDAIQTSAALNSGNSGGPLLDASGKVVGINSQVASSPGGGFGQTTTPSGIGFAVSINTAKKILS